MKKNIFAKLLLVLLLLSPVHSSISANNYYFLGTTGKIAGTVIDEFGETLVGVQVFIEGTTRGTITDVDGKYSIVNLDPGTYTVVFSYIGFATTKVEKVEVIVDKTTTVDMTMQEEVIEGQEIVVTAERPIVEKDRTTTTSYISSEQLEALPLVSIGEAINQQAGVVDGHFRGGRIGEVAYLVNGVPINNPYNNEASFDVEQNMVSSLEVISGVFNAEYGQATSGVVNIVTKGVPSEFSGNFLGFAGRIFSNRDLEFVTRNTDNQFNSYLGSDFSSETFSYTDAAPNIGDQDYQVSIGMPIIKDKLGIQSSLRYVKFDGHLIGRDLFRPDDQQSDQVQTGDNRDSWLLESSGSGDFESLNRQERFSINSSLIYQFTSRIKFDYNIFYQFGDGRNYDHGFKYNPSGINNYEFSNQTHIAALRFTMSNNSFANVSYSYIKDQSDSFLYDSVDDLLDDGTLDARYVEPAQASQQGAFAFNMGGNYLGSSQEVSKTHTIVTDYTTQLNNVVLWKSGISARFHELDNQSLSFGISGDTRIIRQSAPLQVNPWEAAAYTQVKLEFDELIVNAGLRFDYFDPDFLVTKDVQSFDARDLTPEEIREQLTETETYYQLSPRLGVAFPISETGVMRFSAGLFLQTPRLALLYTNPTFVFDAQTNDEFLGNANLDPERTLQFEVGLQQGLTETMGLDLTVFSKDVRELASQDIVRGAGGGNRRSILENVDFGTVRGVTLSLYERGRGQFSWTMDYTLQFASGSASDPNERFNREVSGTENIITINRLNWDRRHVLNNSITWNTTFGLTLSALNSLQSGNPYTTERDQLTSLIPNNEDAPTWFNSDIRAYYKPPALSHNVEFFVQIDNVFDTNPHFGIYTDTGLADESTDLQRLQNTEGSNPGGLNSYEEWFLDQARRGAPRSVKIGLSYNF